MPIEWDRPLNHRRGSTRRLAGLDVYYDFNWREVFNHNRAIFPNGQSLAELVARECPEGKRATLLLTERDDVPAAIRELDDRYIVIVPVNEYLARAGADAASTFYARVSGASLTRLTSLSDALFNEAELGRFLQTNLDQERLEQWAAAAPQNRKILKRAAGARSSSGVEILSLLQQIQAVDLNQLNEIFRRLGEIGGPEFANRAFEVLTSSPDGRQAAALAIAERLEGRIRDARRQLSLYQDLVADVQVGERDVQRFLEANPWIVGLTYARVRPRVAIPRGELDFVLDRYDGFFDLLELKSPSADIITEARNETDRPLSASGYSVGQVLSNALAQSHLYRANLEQSNGLAAQFGLADTRQPRVMILVGRASDLSDTGREILRQLNLSLHRVEILPYDVLAQRTEGWLRNIENMVGISEGVGE